MQIFGLIPLFFIFIAKFSFAELAKVNIYQVLVLGVVNAFGYLMFYKALKKGEVSIIGPMISSYSAFSLLFSAFYFKESLNYFIVLCLLIIVVGIAMSSIDYKKIFTNKFNKKDFIKGLPEAILAILILSLWFPLWGSYISNNSWIISLLLLRFFFSLTLLTLLIFDKTKIVIKQKNIIGWLIIVGILDLLAYISLTWGYSDSNYKSIVTVLASVFSVPTIILARIFLKEKLQLLQIVGIVVIFIGIVLLAFYRG